jgi:hypothetical protein
MMKPTGAGAPALVTTMIHRGEGIQTPLRGETAMCLLWRKLVLHYD